MDMKFVVSQVKVKAGECIKLNGSVMPEAKSFEVNIGRNAADLILHFNPRFDSRGDTKTIVLNSMSCGEWDEELRESLFPFQQGEETTISISFDEKEVKIKLPGDQELSFPNRRGLDSVGFLSVNGDFRMKSIEFD
ncbi:16 kDa beta-galactoside-binding lectin-like [Heteronotia binoei]|uniref:16 kDa beta-galactoside-binding lectin-like n=1 Tax=Heteronotia binoei TaxID=13085 RepID=UPI0029306E9F|nr:16 kDa beta-galactoside-binding lectin-like [Heteronotia binoei]